MSDVNTVKCDATGCNRVKQETNNWFVLAKYPNYIKIMTAEKGKGVPKKLRLDLCGVSCTLKAAAECLQPLNEGQQ